MDRFCDHISIYELKGDLYNPFGGENDINMSLVYRGECKAKLHQFYGSHSLPEDEGYTITINETDLTNINVRNIAFLKTNNNSNDKIKLTIVEVKRYERNTVIHAIALKDGDNSGDPNHDEPYIYADDYIQVVGALSQIENDNNIQLSVNADSIVHVKLRTLHDSFGNPMYLRITPIEYIDETSKDGHSYKIINTNTEAYIYSPTGIRIKVEIIKRLEIEYADEAGIGEVLLPVANEDIISALLNGEYIFDNGYIIKNNNDIPYLRTGEQLADYYPYDYRTDIKYAAALLKKDEEGEYTDEVEVADDCIVADSENKILYRCVQDATKNFDDITRNVIIEKFQIVETIIL